MKETQKTLEKEAFVEIQPKRPAVTLDSFEEPLRGKLQRLLETKAHSHPDLDVVRLIDLLADLGLEKWDKLKKAKRALKEIDAPVPALIKVKEAQPHSQSLRRETLTDRNAAGRVSRPYLPSTIRHAVFLKSQGKCSNCGTGRAIEIDHIVPVAMGGSSEIGNLRILCRSCNQRSAIERFGQDKMRSYLNSPAADYRTAG